MRTVLLSLGLIALGAAFFLPLVGLRDRDTLPLEARPSTAADPEDRAFEDLANRTASGEVLEPSAWVALLDGMAERAWELEPRGEPERLRRVSLFLAWTGRLWPWLAGGLLVLVVVTKGRPWLLRAVAMTVGTIYGGLALWPLVAEATAGDAVEATLGAGLWGAAAGGVLVFLAAPFGKRPVLTFFVGSLLPLVVLGAVAAWIAYT